MTLQLQIVNDTDNKQDPFLSSKVYRHLDENYPVFSDGTKTPVLVIFHCSQQQKGSSEIGPTILNCLPPRDIPKKISPPF